MVHRLLYQSTICQAASASTISCVVSRRQCTGSVPRGGSRSITSTTVTVTDFGRSRSRVYFGRVASRLVRRASQFDLAEPQRQLRHTCGALALAFRQRNDPRRDECKTRRRRVEALAVRQTTVVHGARDHMEVRRRHRPPCGENVALAVREHRDHGGGRQYPLALLGGVGPAMGFLLAGRALL